MSVTKQVTIVNHYGIHCRPSALIVKEAYTFPDCEIKLVGVNGDTDARDTMGIMTLELVQGAIVTVIAEGKDEETACEKIATLIGSNFDFER